MIHTGDCLDVMAGMPDASVDAVVTDPPYGLEFMGKGWDKFGAAVFHDPSKLGGYQDGNGGNAYSRSRVQFHNGLKAMLSYQAWCEAWGREALRVTVPGGYLLAFGGTRTHHRLVCGLEDAGWLIRDELDWIYASGFPKGRANLKPAHEPIVLARKPGPLRMLGIDACRIPVDPSDPVNGAVWTSRPSAFRDGTQGFVTTMADGDRNPANAGEKGRWPANVILTDPVFDGGVDGVVGGGETEVAWWAPDQDRHESTSYRLDPAESTWYGDSGTYSRFFLIPKADRSDREPPLRADTEPYEHSGPRGHSLNGDGTPRATSRPRANVHPTVKPIELMRHLVRLVTPTRGTVLDPFLGSGTTAIACEMEGFAWIGIEKEPEYVRIAEARLNGVQKGLGLPA